jgi:hypothetical protein
MRLFRKGDETAVIELANSYGLPKAIATFTSK